MHGPIKSGESCAEDPSSYRERSLPEEPEERERRVVLVIRDHVFDDLLCDVREHILPGASSLHVNIRIPEARDSVLLFDAHLPFTREGLEESRLEDQQSVDVWPAIHRTLPRANERESSVSLLDVGEESIPPYSDSFPRVLLTTEGGIVSERDEEAVRGRSYCDRELLES